MSDDPKKDKKTDPKIEELKNHVQEYKNKYLRALADYQNFEKRMREEKDEIRSAANRDLILRLLTFLDNLDKADVFIKDEGLKMIKDNFFNILKSEGLEEIDVLGREFDPYMAEVVDIIEGKEDNIVVEILRRGFKYHGKILRVAQVKVSKQKINDAENPKT